MDGGVVVEVDGDVMGIEGVEVLRSR